MFTYKYLLVSFLKLTLNHLLTSVDIACFLSFLLIILIMIETIQMVRLGSEFNLIYNTIIV